MAHTGQAMSKKVCAGLAARVRCFGPVAFRQQRDKPKTTSRLQTHLQRRLPSRPGDLKPGFILVPGKQCWSYCLGWSKRGARSLRFPTRFKETQKAAVDSNPRQDKPIRQYPLQGKRAVQGNREKTGHKEESEEPGIMPGSFQLTHRGGSPGKRIGKRDGGGKEK